LETLSEKIYAEKPITEDEAKAKAKGITNANGIEREAAAIVLEEAETKAQIINALTSIRKRLGNIESDQGFLAAMAALPNTYRQSAGSRKYNEMSKKELINSLKSLNIQVSLRKTKAEMIELLRKRPRAKKQTVR
jgi:hypothetical protein